MSRPGEVLVEGDASKNIPDTTCEQWDKLLSLEMAEEELVSTTPAEGRDAAANAALTVGCDASKQQAETRTGMQLDGLCGCSNVQPARQCDVCGEGFVVSSSTEECTSVAFVAPYITNSSQCEFVQASASQLDCCVEGVETESDQNAFNDAPSSANIIGSGAFLVTGSAVIAAHLSMMF
jgi:hypothetical protein